MATAVSICSNALLRLGADSINSFDEGDTSGDNIERVRLCSNLWPTVRKRMLRAHNWNEATKRVALAASVAVPAFGWASQFQLPGDWLRNVEICDVNGVANSVDYETEGGFLLCNETIIYLKYIWDNDNPATYTSTLVDALEVAMMQQLAYPVTKSTSLASELGASLVQILREARSFDSKDDPDHVLGDYPLLSSRFGNWR